MSEDGPKISDVPSGATLDCPKCGEATHRILKGRVSGKKGETLECVVKCSECGDVRKVTIKREKPVTVKIIVSDEDRSKRTGLELLPSEEIVVGDRMILDGQEVEVSSIESDGRRVEVALAKEIDTLWTKRADRVKVKFSITKGRRTLSKEIFAQPDEEFYVGDLVELGRMKVVIHRIKCRDRMIRDGSATASSIVRIYAKGIKEVWA
ncbi:MAG: HVO_0476 family zinc finger protein [Thermoplasmata archaeon]